MVGLSLFYPRLQLASKPQLGLHIVPYTSLQYPSSFGFLTSFARTVSLFFFLVLLPALASRVTLCVTLLSSLRPYLAIEIRACRAHTEHGGSSLLLLTRSCPSCFVKPCSFRHTRRFYSSRFLRFVLILSFYFSFFFSLLLFAFFLFGDFFLLFFIRTHYCSVLL